MVVCYVDQIAPDNWLTVRTEFTGELVSIPYGVKLDLTGTAGGREQFTILEGVNEGTEGSVARKSGERSYLTVKLIQKPAATVVFDRAAQSLTFGGRGPYNAFSGGGFGATDGTQYTPVPKGRYALAIPAFPSKQTRSAYLQWTRFHKTWFRIGTDLSGSRFLHPGEISEGCVTVRQFLFNPADKTLPVPGGQFADLPGLPGGATGIPVPQHQAPTPGGDVIYDYAPVIGWDTIYDYLILARASRQAVGSLTVI
jgi:hypothetical protein